MKLLAAKAQGGVRVWIIVSHEDAKKNGETMKDASSVDLTDLLYTQQAVHNKGFIIDGRAVVVSSQNFSSAGVEKNRDANVIIESPQVAADFSCIFEEDFSNQAKPFVAVAKASARKASRRRPANKAVKTARRRSGGP